MTPHEQVIALLELRDSWIPGPKTWTGQIVLSSSKPGETPSKRIECPACNGTGKRGRDVCDRCKRGVLVVDDYTGRTADARPETADVAVLERREKDQKRDAEIMRLERMERVRRGDEATDDLLTIAYERRRTLYRIGSFEELDRCLDRLESEWPMLARAVSFVYDGAEGVMRPSLRQSADQGVELIAEWMPKPIKVPRFWQPAPRVMVGKGRWANGAAQKERNRLIRRMSEVEGLSDREIARRVGLSHVQVANILAAEKAA